MWASQEHLTNRRFLKADYHDKRRRWPRGGEYAELPIPAAKQTFAHRLTEALSARDGLAWAVPVFEVPSYLREAIEYIVKGTTSSSSPGAATNENPVSGTTIGA